VRQNAVYRLPLSERLLVRKRAIGRTRKSPPSPGGSEYVAALMPQTALTACPPHFRISWVQGFTVMPRLFLFHSAPACDTVPLVGMSLWKLQYASLATSRRALSSGGQSRQSETGVTGGPGFKACDVIQEPGKSKLRANSHLQTSGDVRSSNTHCRGLKSPIVIDSSVDTLSTYILHNGNDNVM
jgi:hypothetical protein